MAKFAHGKKYYSTPSKPMNPLSMEKKSNHSARIGVRNQKNFCILIVRGFCLEISEYYDVLEESILKISTGGFLS